MDANSSLHKQKTSPLIKPMEAGKISLMGHLIVDWPSVADCAQIVEIMASSGARVIEVQIPFSEPMADGPVIMAANHGALAAGVSVSRSFEFMKQMTTRYELPFIFMTYTNIIFKYGWKKFVEDAVAAGARGIIVPDLPIEMSSELDEACAVHRFANIRVIPPNVSDERLEQLCASANGMIYVVARAGVTGAATDFGSEVFDFVARVRKHTDLPIAVGFGISKREQVQYLVDHCDLAVIGSQTFREHDLEGIAGVRTFWNSLNS